MASILVVDGDEAIRNVIAKDLEEAGHEAIKAVSYDHAIELVEAGVYDIVVAGLEMSQPDGMDVLKVARNRLPDAAVIMLLHHNSMEMAPQAMELGAWDYIVAPISLQQLSLTIRRALERQQLAASARRLRKQIMEKYTFKNLVAGSEKMLHAVELAKRASAASDPVLITGEDGTGKQLLASIIHTTSARRREPFISADLSIMDQDVMELTLFGSICGATARRERSAGGTRMLRSVRGTIERADRGTILLNEIETAPPRVQEKLLDLLEYNILSRVGSEEAIYVNARLIVTSSNDAAESVRGGRLRADLFYQLDQNSIHLPPLKERRGDIPLLVERFIGEYSEQLGKQIHSVSPEFLSFLTAYDWPGNVRELRNAIENVVAFASEAMISPLSLPLDATALSTRIITGILPGIIAPGT